MYTHTTLMLVQVVRKILEDPILGFQVFLHQEVEKEGTLSMVLGQMVVQEAVAGEPLRADWQSHLLQTWSQESPCPTCPFRSAGAEQHSAQGATRRARRAPSAPSATRRTR